MAEGKREKVLKRFEKLFLRYTVKVVGELCLRFPNWKRTVQFFLYTLVLNSKSYILGEVFY